MDTVLRTCLAAQPVDFCQVDITLCERFFRPNKNAACFGLNANNVKWLGSAANINAAPLPNRKIDNAVMLAQYIAINMDNITRINCAGAQATDDAGIIAIWHKANVLTVGFAGNGQVI